ncbi:MAG: DUF1801 domain-containing protein [Opitutus sp.]|nr:DUF1801 domain-containing protein [Opitutus sp.]
MKPPSPQTQLAGFIAKFTPEVGALTKAVLAKMRRRLPNAVEMVYDNYNFLVFGFGPTERASEAILSVAVYARGVTLCFLHGATLPDPEKCLQGSGKRVRHVKLPTATTLDEPAIQSLIAAALVHAPVPLTASTRRRLIIKSISAKQRPRRPAAAI